MSNECPHGNEVNERCAQCVANGGQNGDQFARRYRMNAQAQYAADGDLRRKAETQLRRRVDAENARQAAVEATQQRLNYPQGGDE